MKNFLYVTVEVEAIKLTWRVLLFNYIESNLTWKCLPTLLSYAAPFHFGWLNANVVKSVENNFLGFWNFDRWSSWSHPDKRRISFHHGQRYGCWGSTRALGYVDTKGEGKKLRPKLFDRWIALSSGYLSIQWITQLVSSWIIHWIVWIALFNVWTSPNLVS